MANHVSPLGNLKIAATLLVFLGLATALAACGQRGPLVAPTANTNTQTQIEDPSVGDTNLGQDEDTGTATKAPDEGFILDPLL